MVNLAGRFDDAGELTAVEGYVLDVTQRKREYDALEQANEQLLVEREELQQQVLELAGLKDWAEHATQEMEWLAHSHGMS